jgi:prophage tail gpP-like protein
MITLEVDSTPYQGFTEISVLRSVGAISGSFSFTATSSKKISLPIQMGQSCRVLINETPVINGYVEAVNIDYDANTHNIGISGRDKTMDVIDSSTVIKELSGTLSLKQVIRQILDGNGLQNIGITNLVSGLKSFNSGDIESAEVGETVFEYIDKYARKRQVLLTGDGDGNIVITRSGTTNAITSLLNVINGTNNNILSASASYAETNLFNKYTVRSQQNPVALKNSGSISTANLVSQSGTATDNEVRATRILEVRPSQSGSSKDSKEFALWLKNINRGKSFNYTAVIQGYYQDLDQTKLWIPNEIVSIKDDFIGMSSQLNAEMLIDTVEYKLSNTEGSTTVITCVDKNAYTLEAKANIRDARANDLGK